eukprot:CAMPEP_0114524424 /NCGR_PEP_ID=MMETSP0109-20121206/21848_1 /TAXON_ID=29199 /ORGANISM="Chlorarachnion reptans, Strain CCCM449" /LENGTH=211 /DNA_ID=CAMNT_0001705867 /DNA_START=34 /DNA_END=669 /DNA_ORIENTATION=+
MTALLKSSSVFATAHGGEAKRTDIMTNDGCFFSTDLDSRPNEEGLAMDLTSSSQEFVVGSPDRDLSPLRKLFDRTREHVEIRARRSAFRAPHSVPVLRDPIFNSSRCTGDKNYDRLKMRFYHTVKVLSSDAPVGRRSKPIPIPYARSLDSPLLFHTCKLQNPRLASGKSSVLDQRSPPIPEQTAPLEKNEAPKIGEPPNAPEDDIQFDLEI